MHKSVTDDHLIRCLTLFLFLAISQRKPLTTFTSPGTSPSSPQVAVEAFGGELDFEKLEGTWRLLYTTASDVVCSAREEYFGVGGSYGSCSGLLSDL